MTKVISFILVLFISLNVNATHNRAGEITFRYLGQYAYEVKIITYTANLGSGLQGKVRFDLPINWGDGSPAQLILRDNQSIQPEEYLPNDYILNTYTAIHNYPGPGTYEIFMQDPNRNKGVNNIPSPDATYFSIKTSITVGSIATGNSAPILLNPPNDNAGLNRLFVHNPAAYDVDGDSVAYELTTCTGIDGLPISGYVLPPASKFIKIDSETGNLVWDSPTQTGLFNIAMFVKEYRNGVLISRITRDMQISVQETNNQAPTITTLNDTCVHAGKEVRFTVDAMDPDNDNLTLSLTGGPMRISGNANFNTETGEFTWTPQCKDARKQPYVLVAKAEDDDATVKLSALENININVLHNPVTGIITNPGMDTVGLRWNRSTCGDPRGYFVYRKRDSISVEPDSCDVGVPSKMGYERIATLLGANNTHHIDDDNGFGLVPGYDYCYRITAFYIDGAESFASEKVCTQLVPGTPSILKVSVETIDSVNGEIDLAWAYPHQLDTLLGKQLRYQIKRKLPNDSDFSIIANIPSNDLMDTSYIDVSINTYEFPYAYQVIAQHSDNGADWFSIPRNEMATSTFLDIIGTDNTNEITITKRAPWDIDSNKILRLNENTSNFDTIADIDGISYNDNSLENGRKYVYRAETRGKRKVDSITYDIFNKSHENFGIPIDSIPPCDFPFEFTIICEEGKNRLDWITPYDSCGDDDIVYYKIYHSYTTNTPVVVIDTVNDSFMNYYEHVPELGLAGCYAVTAVDSFENESNKYVTCKDSCEYYSLPNVFTPDGEGPNDIYLATNLKGFIKKVDMKIFNRYGVEVFRTSDPYIRWNGVNEKTGILVPTGVYFYVCVVYEQRITGQQIKNLTGFIHVFSGDNNIISE